MQQNTILFIKGIAADYRFTTPNYGRFLPVPGGTLSVKHPVRPGFPTVPCPSILGRSGSPRASAAPTGDFEAW